MQRRPLENACWRIRIWTDIYCVFKAPTSECSMRPHNTLDFATSRFPCIHMCAICYPWHLPLLLRSPLCHFSTFPSSPASKLDYECLMASSTKSHRLSACLPGVYSMRHTPQWAQTVPALHYRIRPLVPRISRRHRPPKYDRAQIRITFACRPFVITLHAYT